MIALVDVRAATVLTNLKNGQRRLVYAVANAINDTARQVQEAEKQRVSSAFMLRNQRDFILRQAAIIKPFASPTQGRLEARIAVGQKRGLLLPGYEKGFRREPVKGANVAVPITGGARPAKPAAIPAELYISQLGFRRIRGKRRKQIGPGAIEGERGAFIVPPKAGRVGKILQRIGGIVRVLYVFMRPFQVRPRLQFITTAQRTVQTRFAANLTLRASEELVRAGLSR